MIFMGGAEPRQGSPIRSNNTTSTGPIPFMHTIDSVLRAVSRGGKPRPLAEVEELTDIAGTEEDQGRRRFGERREHGGDVGIGQHLHVGLVDRVLRV